MKITFYTAINPKRLLTKTKYKTLSDTVELLNSVGEMVELDAQQAQSYSNTIEVFRNLKLTGTFTASFELHGNISVTIENAQITNSANNQYGTILLAKDFCGTLNIINSKVKCVNSMDKYMAIWHEATSANPYTLGIEEEQGVTQQLTIKDSTVDGVMDNPLCISLSGNVNILSPSSHAVSWLSSSNWDTALATVGAKYCTLVNENSATKAGIHELQCLAGPVEISGIWQFGTLNLNLSEYSEAFKFNGQNYLTNIKIGKLIKTKAPESSSGFYSAHALLDLTGSKLGTDKDHLQATITDTQVIMSHTIDNLTWQLEGVNALKLDQNSVTSLRQRQNEFTGILPEDQAKQTAGSNGAKASDNTDAQVENTQTTNSSSETKTSDSDTSNQVNSKLKDMTDAKNVDTDSKSDKPKQDGMQKLQAMIGLTEVKKKLSDYIEVAKFNVKAKKRGLHVANDMNRHMVFGGNPGTGKTTVAKYVAQILYENDALPEPKFTGVMANDLTKGYKSQTAQKTHEIVESAVGGVLLIDEAYTLADTENTFSGEAVTQLLTELENHHDDLIVILAGYTDKMHKFMETTNQGFASRIRNWIDFPDYTDAEKIQIFKKDCNDGGTICPDDIINSKAFKTLIFKFYARDHANARDVRNFYQDLTQARINRVNPQMDKLTNEEIMTITAQDLNVVYKNAVKTMKRERALKKKKELEEQKKQQELTNKAIQAGFYSNNFDQGKDG